METTTLRELVDLLRGPTLRVRVGLWLVPQRFVGQEKDEAARLAIDTVDMRLLWLEGLPIGTRFAGISVDGLVEKLDVICQRSQGGDCILVSNLDLLLARLRQAERADVWSQLYNVFSHRQRALLIGMSAGAEHLLPTTEMLAAWRKDGRLAEAL